MFLNIYFCSKCQLQLQWLKLFMQGRPEQHIFKNLATMALILTALVGLFSKLPCKNMYSLEGWLLRIIDIKVLVLQLISNSLLFILLIVSLTIFIGGGGGVPQWFDSHSCILVHGPHWILLRFTPTTPYIEAFYHHFFRIWWSEFSNTGL